MAGEAGILPVNCPRESVRMLPTTLHQPPPSSIVYATTFNAKPRQIGTKSFSTDPASHVVPKNRIPAQLSSVPDNSRATRQPSQATQRHVPNPSKSKPNQDREH
ncbi:hypothetical protein BC567DRAFT_90936 [Phyllosticta citribraziliensis]